MSVYEYQPSLTHTRTHTHADNVAMHAGSGILYLTRPLTTSYVENSTFVRSAAGSFRSEKLLKYKDSFRVNGDEVQVSRVT